MVGTARILPLYSLQIVKGDKKGQIKESGKLLFCIFSNEKTGCRREGKVYKWMDLCYLTRNGLHHTMTGDQKLNYACNCINEFARESKYSIHTV